MDINPWDTQPDKLDKLFDSINSVNHIYPLPLCEWTQNNTRFKDHSQSLNHNSTPAEEPAGDAIKVKDEFNP